MSHTSFDFKIAMRAIQVPHKSSFALCYIDMLPTEILCMIFDHFAGLTVSGRGAVPPPILLSHISRHWRRVALSTPALWEKLYIYHIRRPDVLREFLLRSNNRYLYIFIDLPQTIFWAGDDIPEFDETFSAIAKHIPRIKYLSITARGQTIRQITNKYFVNVPLPSLQYFELVVCHHVSFAVFGPFNFNPRVFSSIRLERAMIEVKDGACLAGLRVLVLSYCPLTYLDQRNIPSFNYAVAPMNWYTDLPAPSLARLTGLHIHAPVLHPVPGLIMPPLVNMHGHPVPPLPFSPSFRAESLRSLTLSSLSLSKMPYDQPMNPDILARLFRIVCLAEIVELHLVDMKDEMIEGFLQALRLQNCRFAHLRVLMLTGGTVDRIAEFSEEIGVENYRLLMSHAFPFLYELHVTKLDPRPLLSLWERIRFWPMLKRVIHDDQVVHIPTGSTGNVEQGRV
ncbi:hypothetical protein AMATHDRAFT_39045 [Amanita thiersii Skay4041]|uniref:Uncharacterized protein n=1 Tax=Amanita thiersii Skay4041 TaxID=703135 RepID=A0A2A9NQA2_9AGAR|nr:hypothetical protein AMATHDRAFT_39045 [Amanita thiersii Skay4041]